jgi:two-component system, chemotaxis family, CheB/CheR fusion protein
VSLSAAVIAVDRNLAILIWNHSAEALWGLRAGEAQGRSLPSLDMGLPVARLVGPIQAVLRGDADDQEIMLTATNRRGRTIQCRVTCTPVRGPEGDIQGVILFMEERGGARRPSDNA